MKEFFGFLLVVAGIVAGLYVGVWWAFIGGIIDIVNAFKAVDISGMAVALGLLKVLLAGLAGVLSAFVLIIPGIAMLKS